MINKSIQIITIPKKIKPLIIQNYHECQNIIGYKKINSSQKIPIIQVNTNIRIWTLCEEIYIII